MLFKQFVSKTKQLTSILFAAPEKKGLLANGCRETKEVFDGLCLLWSHRCLRICGHQTPSSAIDALCNWISGCMDSSRTSAGSWQKAAHRSTNSGNPADGNILYLRRGGDLSGKRSDRFRSQGLVAKIAADIFGTAHAANG